MIGRCSDAVVAVSAVSPSQSAAKKTDAAGGFRFLSLASKNVAFMVALSGLVDACIQRGYAWDDKNICVYSQLPSGGNNFGPSGDFIPLANTPVRFKYPYGAFNDNLDTGVAGTTLPFDATSNVRVRIRSRGRDFCPVALGRMVLLTTGPRTYP